MASPDNLPLRDLQKIILGKREEPLSVIEIRNLFSYPTTPESILYIITALNRKKIDPNTTLVQGIANATKKQDLVPIALALRYGADPNLYVNAPNVGDIHILGYTYLALSKKDLALLNSVIIMLVAMGSDQNRLIFDVKGGVIRDEYSLVEPIEGQSVIEWLEDQGYDTIIPQIKGQNYESVDPGFMTMLATFMDRVDLVPEGNTPNLDEIVGAHSVEVFKVHVETYNPEAGLRVSRDYLNLTTYESFTDLGAMLNYGEINDLVLSVGKYKELGDYISMGQIREMLIYSISRGAVLDEFQMALIQETDNRLYEMVKDAYEQPYWIKACATSKGLADDKLKLLSYRLNLYPEAPKNTLCCQIKMITQADPELVKISAVKRQETRIRSDVSYINQFDDGCKPPPIQCSNRSLLSDNLYDFPDADIAYYRDCQNSLWCFTSNNFIKMSEKKVNPYTTEEFPPYFLGEVERKIEFISTYRPIEDMPAPISETIDSLSQPDQPNNTLTERHVKGFEEMLASRNIVNWNMENLTSEDLEIIINDNFNINLNLTDLTMEHAEKTFSVVSYEELRLKPDSADKFFQQIEEKSTNKNQK